MANRDLLVMMKDTPVLRVNNDAGVFEVLREDLLPFPMKGKLREVIVKDNMTRYETSQALIASNVNNAALTSWLANRVLILSRANAKWIYNALSIEQLDSEYNKARFALLCRGVSLLDSYWLKVEGDSNTWDKVDIRKNPLNETIAQIALHGKSITIQGSLISPELTTNGAYAKAWRRRPDGSLWLYKLGAHGNEESRIEVECSGLLDKMNVEHVHYEEAYDDGKYVCACPCISTENKAILSGMDFISYCNANGIDSDTEMMRIDSDSIYKMWIVDYLISNRDRHGQNWGFFYDVDTMKILKCHPLFDHNNAFDVNYMQDKDAKYQFCGMSIKEAAHYAIKKVDFHFTDDFTREDFITERHYKSFIDRASDLGISVIRNKGESLGLLKSMANQNKDI